MRFVPRGGLSVDTWDTLRAYALLRCAELTLEGGHRYFIVEGDEAGDSEGLGIEGLLSHWEATSPRTERIKTFHENPDTGSTTVYDAAAVVRTVRAKYELD